MIRGSQARKALADWMSAPTLVLGIGNALRGDDAVGPMVCARVGSGGVVDCGDAPERYLGLAGEARAARVLMVDAVDFGGEPGELVFCRLKDLVERFGTTHDSCLGVLARYIEQEHGKPVAVLGVQPADTRFGAPVHTLVQAAIDQVSALLQSAMAQYEAGRMQGAWTQL
jgi:hydrogenase 3 maturation protease